MSAKRSALLHDVTGQKKMRSDDTGGEGGEGEVWDDPMDVVDRGAGGETTARSMRRADAPGGAANASVVTLALLYPVMIHFERKRQSAAEVSYHVRFTSCLLIGKLALSACSAVACAAWSIPCRFTSAASASLASPHSFAACCMRRAPSPSVVAH